MEKIKKLFKNYLSFANTNSFAIVIITVGAFGILLLMRTWPYLAVPEVWVEDGNNHYFQKIRSVPEWRLLDFSNSSLSENFRISFIDRGTKKEEWSEIAIQKNKL